MPSTEVLFARYEGLCKAVRIALHFNSCSSYSADIDGRHFGSGFQTNSHHCHGPVHCPHTVNDPLQLIPPRCQVQPEFNFQSIGFNPHNLLEQPFSLLLDEMLGFPFCPISCHLHLLREKVAPFETPCWHLRSCSKFTSSPSPDHLSTTSATMQLSERL